MGLFSKFFRKGKSDKTEVTQPSLEVGKGTQSETERVYIEASNATEYGFKQALYIKQNPCSCGGEWEKGTISFGSPGSPSARFIDCRCSKCGKEKEFTFLLR